MRKKLTIKEMQEIAKRKKGLCLSKKYINAKTKLKWECKNKHIWEAIPDSIRRGYWCPKCGIKNRADKQRGTIEEMQKIAKQRDGNCLSKQYKNVNSKLKWKCKEGHIWEAIPNHIKKGSWCPQCYTYLCEKICRGYFEIFFNDKFPTTYPKWLNRKHLDGYNKRLKLAFEYHGSQHYKQHGFFGGKRVLEKRKEHDKLKKRLCKKYDIRLIIIPYWITNENKGDFIKKECEISGIKIPKLSKKTKEILNNYKLLNIYSNNKLKEMQGLAKRKEGLCLSKRYINNHTNLKWQCFKGHIWEAISNNIKKGEWCPVCAGHIKLNIEEMQEIAKKRRGLCLSEKYINCDTKLEWQCFKGHIWQATPGHIKFGEWCPVCAKFNRILNRKGKTAKLTIEEMQRIAKDKKGICLSKEYINANSKLLWQCSKGHK